MGQQEKLPMRKRKDQGFFSNVSKTNLKFAFLKFVKR